MEVALDGRERRRGGRVGHAAAAGLVDDGVEAAALRVGRARARGRHRRRAEPGSQGLAAIRER